MAREHQASVKEPTSPFIIKANLLYRLFYFSPVLVFLWIIPSMQQVASSIEWQIYFFSLFLIITLALNAGVRPLVKIEGITIMFYHTISGRLLFAYLPDIRYVEVKRHLLTIHQRKGSALNSPVLSQRSLRMTLQELERHHIPIIYLQHHQKH
ncbi:hypothetical protein PVA45_00460 [Entomospira entomophila]|uniref:Uncharacterized protein n=1 Tax=Entomospira entomophila TaxID=2719988 RepID=A0A968G7G7_9SPIO|nr:hypothetical protein [Entomospira entomophilus]NIZ39993.1 hypothetical protein [Entomospira entomophilus]WDI35553.1 hypothetical protein PVA45_00460 [Entomospira entomophilus]